MRISIVLVFALLPLWASLARAQQQPAQSTGSFGTLTPLQSPTSATAVTYPALASQPFGTEHLFGDWWGARTWLESHGVDVGLGYFISSANSNSTTGGWTSRRVGYRWAPTSRPRRSTAPS